MPIDPTPEGGEVLHQPVVKPFPESNKPAAEEHEAEQPAPSNGALDGQTPPPR